MVVIMVAADVMVMMVVLLHATPRHDKSLRLALSEKKGNIQTYTWNIYTRKTIQKSSAHSEEKRGIVYSTRQWAPTSTCQLPTM